MSNDSAMLGKRVRAARIARGWSKADLVRKSGVSATYVTRLEDGKYKRPSVELISKIANALGVSVLSLSEPPAEIAPGLAEALHAVFYRPEDASTLADALADLARHDAAQQRQVVATIQALVRTIPRRD